MRYRPRHVKVMGLAKVEISTAHMKQQKKDLLKPKPTGKNR